MAGEDDNVGDISPERLANFMIKQLKAMPEEQRADHLERLKQDMPLIHGMVEAGLDTREIHSAPPEVPEPAVDPPTEKPKPGKIMQWIEAFKAFMGALRGGGVWATCTILLLTCCFLVHQLSKARYEALEANNKIVEILLAVRVDKLEDYPGAVEPVAGPVPHPTAPAVNPARKPDKVFDPDKILNRYHNQYESAVTQQAEVCLDEGLKARLDRLGKVPRQYQIKGGSAPRGF